MKPETKIKIVYVSTLIGIILWLGILFFAPYLKSQGIKGYAFLYAIFSPVCHQIPSRCFSFFGYPLAVCTRCLGIYSGFLAGTGLYPLFRNFSSVSMPKPKSFILFSVPIAADAIGNLLSLWTSTGWIRFSIGFIWGTILPFYFISGISELLLFFKKK